MDDVAGVAAQLHALGTSSRGNASYSLAVLRGHHSLAFGHHVGRRRVNLSNSGGPGSIADLYWRLARDFYRVGHSLFSVIAHKTFRL